MTPSFVSSRLMQKSSIGKTLITASMSLMLTACGNLSGLQDASSDFACSVDMPARCQSLSAVHESINRHETQDSSDTIKCNLVLVATQVLPMLPVFAGISGSCSTMFNMLCSSVFSILFQIKILYSCIFPKSQSDIFQQIYSPVPGLQSHRWPVTHYVPSHILQLFSYPGQPSSIL